MNKPTSKRSPSSRHNNEEIQETTQHVETMNGRTQYTLAKAPRRMDLTYYDEIICPPGERCLSDVDIG